MSRLLVFMMTVLAGIAQAQPMSKRADPADPHAVSPPLRFETGLAVPKASSSVDPAANWREHNDRVRSIGGHAGHLKAGASDGSSAPRQARPVEQKP